MTSVSMDVTVCDHAHGGRLGGSGWLHPVGCVSGIFDCVKVLKSKRLDS